MWKKIFFDFYLYESPNFQESQLQFSQQLVGCGLEDDLQMQNFEFWEFAMWQFWILYMNQILLVYV
jgi:hypothetical protein